MKTVWRHRVIGPLTAIIGTAAGLASIGAATAASLANAPPGALSCSGCHANAASVETPVPRLAGLDANAIVAAMQAFRAGQKPATVMDRIAKGFTDEEIKAIAAWYAAQRD
jgi:sulfide dehydrogenase cytochrome subunit